MGALLYSWAVSSHCRVACLVPVIDLTVRWPVNGVKVYLITYRYASDVTGMLSNLPTINHTSMKHYAYCSLSWNRPIIEAEINTWIAYFSTIIFVAIMNTYPREA